jgi:hypothetical protein
MECIAVGQVFRGSAGSSPVAEAWDGSTWTIENVPLPGGAAGGVLNSIACPSASACTAVGQSAAAPLAESWNGTAWTDQTIPSPPGASQSQLVSVSCPQATQCTAVGYWSGAKVGEAALAERY